MALNGYQHGSGDPNTLSPVPDCGASRFYIDDSTQNMYIASQGSPTAWRSAGVVARLDQTGLSANVASTAIFTPSVTGFYEVGAYVVVTTAATTSSTMPAVWVQWNDVDANAQVPFAGVSATATTNAVGTSSTGAGGNTRVIYAQAGQPVNVKTASYATSGATAMLYAVHVVVKHVG